MPKFKKGSLGFLLNNYFPGADFKYKWDVMVWEFTSYPAGDYDTWERQLLEAKSGISELGFDGYRDKVHADMYAEKQEFNRRQVELNA